MMKKKLLSLAMFFVMLAFSAESRPVQVLGTLTFVIVGNEVKVDCPTSDEVCFSIADSGQVTFCERVTLYSGGEVVEEFLVEKDNYKIQESGEVTSAQFEIVEF